VAFDLDGTLFDSRATIARACNRALVALGRPPRSEAEIGSYVGDGARFLLARALGEPDASYDKALVEAAYVHWLAAYLAHPADGTTWMPGAEAALEACAALGLPIAMVTNKAREATMGLLEALGITARFALVVAGGDDELKPSPSPILRVARELGQPVQNLWMVGDGPQDVRAARAAGAFAVAVRGGLGHEAAVLAAEPHLTIESLTQLPACLESALAGADAVTSPSA
jgi:phosphoglycolate phosphatase